MNKHVTTFGISVFLIFTFWLSASAQTTCLVYNSGSAAPTGYGASWDVFSFARELLVKSNCPTSGNSITITVGRGNNEQYVWKDLYTYNNGWTQHTLSGTQEAGWIHRKGSKAVTAPSWASSQNPFYFVGYVCTLVGSNWKCGCANQSCAVPSWQIQGYMGTGGGGGSGPQNPLPAPERTLSVDGCANLPFRIIESTPGTHVLLEPGTYNCDLVVNNKNGTASAPIVVRARVPLSVTINGMVRVTGNYIGIHGLRFNGSIFRLSGRNQRISSNYFSGYTGCYRIMDTNSSVAQLRVDHNEIASNNGCAGSGDGPNSYTFFFTTEGGAGTYNYLVDHNYFHDNRSGNLIFVGTDNRSREYTTNHVIEYNLFERESDSAGEGGSGTAIYTKSSGNTIQFNTLINSNRHHTNRLGRNNLWKNNWIEDSDGLLILDCDNRVVGNKIIGSPTFGISLGSGTLDCDDPFDTGEAVHRAASNTLVVGNEANILKIGQYIASGRPIPVTATRLEANTFGSQSINPDRSQGLSESDTASIEPGTAIKLTPSQVGPNAPTAPRF